jgi:type VI secretion system protein ImpE
MGVQELYQAGQLGDAIASLSASLRADPTDTRQRTFLFELLCFAGEFDRAERQLDVLAGEGHDSEMGALVYRSALYAERRRSEMFERNELSEAAPLPQPAAVSGRLNGNEFASLTDADPRIGARLELFVAGQYMWLPLEHVASVTTEPPQRLRDLLWIPAHVVPSPRLAGLQLGEVLLPVTTPLAWRHADNLVRLGRVTEWQRLDSGVEVPAGQKLLLADGEEIPMLEVRTLEILAAPGAP